MGSRGELAAALAVPFGARARPRFRRATRVGPNASRWRCRAGQPLPPLAGRGGVPTMFPLAEDADAASRCAGFALGRGPFAGGCFGGRGEALFLSSFGRRPGALFAATNLRPRWERHFSRQFFLEERIA